jgi:hypothetical protein
MNTPTHTPTPLRRKVVIILDNGGGITLQISGRYQHRYQHTYQDPAQAATDISAATEPACDLSDWEGNEHGWLIPTQDEIRNGGYSVYSLADFLATAPEDIWGLAGQKLRAALATAKE